MIKKLKTRLKAFKKYIKPVEVEKPVLKVVDAPVAADVEQYYNDTTPAYVENYGNIIQAARPANDNDFIEYMVNSMGLEDGMQLLDAGCGICGPAVSFAKSKQVNIEAVTISEVQVEESKKFITQNHLNDRINVTKGNFSDLHNIYPQGRFDLIYFLETLGYATDVEQVLASATRVLKQGGFIYIKDFFVVPMLDDESKNAQHHFVEEVRREYLYKVLEITNLISISRKLGLYIEFVKPLAVEEDFTKAAQFEIGNSSHSIYTRAITFPYRLFEVLELKLKKVYF